MQSAEGQDSNTVAYRMGWSASTWPKAATVDGDTHIQGSGRPRRTRSPSPSMALLYY